MSIQRTLVILKPSTVQRGLVGTITNRFERKGLRLAGMKMMQLDDKILSEHYAHILGKPYCQRVINSMKSCPVIVCCYEGVDAVEVIRSMTGCTDGKKAAPGTIRGDFSMSAQENIIHTSDSPENAAIELARFFKSDEFFDYKLSTESNIFHPDEVL